MATTAFWFRRDLRLKDNTGLYNALKTGQKVLAVFIFDENIIGELPFDDPRTNFIYDSLDNLNNQLLIFGGGLLIRKGKPVELWKSLITEYKINKIYANHDYEPYAIQRDKEIAQLCNELNIGFKTFKDQVIFEKDDILKPDGKPYTVFTPYKKRWLAQLKNIDFQQNNLKSNNNLLVSPNTGFPN